MAGEKQERLTRIRVGAFVIAALTIGGTLAFTVGTRRNMFGSKVHLWAVFDAVDGLRPGSPVRIGGYNVGAVSKVELRDDGKVHVELGVNDEPAKLVRKDSVAKVGNKGLLGDKQIDISVGKGKPLKQGDTIRTESPVALGKYMSEAGSIVSSVKTTVKNLEKATSPLGDGEFGEDVKAVTKNLARVLESLAEGRGFMGKLFTDPKLGNDVSGLVRELRATSTQLTAMTASMRAIVREVERGDGAVHELVYGKDGIELVESLTRATSEVAELLHDVRTQDGTVHDLVYGNSGEDLIKNLTGISADVKEMTAAARNGKGTLGALLMDPSVYEDVKRLVGDLRRNEVLRALVRYSIRKDEAEGRIPKTE